MNSYTLFVGLFLHLSVLALWCSKRPFHFARYKLAALGEVDIRSINSFLIHSRCCLPKITAIHSSLLSYVENTFVSFYGHTVLCIISSLPKY